MIKLDRVVAFNTFGDIEFTGDVKFKVDLTEEECQRFVMLAWEIYETRKAEMARKMLKVSAPLLVDCTVVEPPVRDETDNIPF